MTRKEAEHILMHLSDYIEWDENYGPLARGPLIDATLVAIKSMRELSEIKGEEQNDFRC